MFGSLLVLRAVNFTERTTVRSITDLDRSVIDLGSMTGTSLRFTGEDGKTRRRRRTSPGSPRLAPSIWSRKTVGRGGRKQPAQEKKTVEQRGANQSEQERRGEERKTG